MNTQFKRCKRCGKIVQLRMGGYCDECFKELDEKYITVRDYLYDNPNASIQQIVEDTEVEEDTIFLFLQEGRLQLKHEGSVLHCEKCGKPISHGRYCEACKNKMTNLLERGMESAARHGQIKAKQETTAPGGGYKSNFMKKQ